MTSILGRFLSSVLVEEYYIVKEMIRHYQIESIIETLPEGNGKPVYLIPGLLNNDRALDFIKKILLLKGFKAQTWGLGMNWGPQNDIDKKMYRSFLKFHDTHGQSTVVGHSFGGFMGVALAHHRPNLVDKVITLGGFHGVKNIHPAIDPVFKILTKRTVKDAWHEATNKGVHTASVPVFHIIGTHDQLLPKTSTRMVGNSPGNTFEIATSHGGLLQSCEAVRLLIELLNKNN